MTINGKNLSDMETEDLVNYINGNHNKNKRDNDQNNKNKNKKKKKKGKIKFIFERFYQAFQDREYNNLCLII